MQPLFPSFRSLDNGDSTELRGLWLSLFDKFNMTVAFENHDHAYKRSKILRNSLVVPTGSPGTLYVGDGSWGVPPREKTEPDVRYYLEVYQEKNFVLGVNVTGGKQIDFQAIDIEGAIFDTFALNGTIVVA